MIISSFSEYGIEFYYVSFVLKIISNFFLLNEENIFQIISIFHIILVILSILTIKQIFKILNIKQIYIAILFLLLFVNNEIFFYFISLKPDLNLLLFTTLVTTYSFLKFIKKNKNKNLFTFIIFLSLSCSIKGWALPFIFLIFFVSNKLSNQNLIFLRKNIPFFFVLLIILLNYYLLDFRSFLNVDHNLLNFKLNILKTYYIENIVNLLIIINIIIFSFAISLNYSRSRLLLLLSIFFISWFFFIFPFISSYEYFFKTLFEHSGYTIINSRYIEYTNIFHYFFLDLLSYRINQIIYFGLFIILFYYLFKFKNSRLENKSELHYIAPLLCIVVSMFFLSFGITTYENQYPGRYLYYIYFIIINFYFFTKLKNFLRFYFIIALILFSSIPLIKKNSILNFLFNKNILEPQLNTMHNEHYNKIIKNYSKIIICGGYYPSDEKVSDNLYIYTKYDNCFNQFKNKDKDIIFYLNLQHYQKPFKFNSNYKVIHQDSYKITNIMEREIELKNIFFKNINR